MYNDEKNLYHYTYREDGSETGEHNAAGQQPAGSQPFTPMHQTGPNGPVQEMKPVKKNRMGLKITALALVCALLGGAIGGGIVYGVGHSSSDAVVNSSGRTVSQVSLKTVDGKTEMTDAEVYAANVNSVVSINTTGTAGTNIFGQPVQTASSGSGFILTTDGYIVTNHHVIADADSVKVTLYNGDTYDATVVGGDEDYDIAVLKIDAEDLQPVTLGDSSKLNVGDRVLAIGNPLGELTFSMSGGMVSSVNRTINVDGTPFNMIQTDASINPGNSGGPLFNSYGEVVGIVSAKYSSYSNESVEGLGFAIPINDVWSMIEDIMTNGYVTNKPYLGATVGTMTEQMAAQYRYDITSGVFIYSVEEGGAADKAGLRMGDVITKVGDTEVNTMEDLNAAKKQYSAGDTVTMTIDRQGETLTVEITWGSVPQEQQVTTQEQSANQPSQGYTDPYDLFDYFFGNGGYSGSSARNAA
ncbi:MAG: trypsin-like peptidase domain-containing protein [Dysosmobacter sp.]|uniref:S1C family serine protease n=1 Tax=Dysosmobacter sp. TaxID=2591382 RepID=UPI00284EFCAC|nr:trypsin-like peptidase domain-containing protein [Dysosmobacter sp.]MDR3983990.1 trypsin-like peptidase domain-containing protein [Dysosmobacter sp.]